MGYCLVFKSYMSALITLYLMCVWPICILYLAFLSDSINLSDRSFAAFNFSGIKWTVGCNLILRN